MIQTESLVQLPTPGSRTVRFRGDALTLGLTLAHPMGDGTAWVRTNIGQAALQRREIIRGVHHEESPLGIDWFDLPMRRCGERRFEATLALNEVGHFEAKCFFLAAGESSPLWPPGPNTVINVEPADACCANTLYNAFVRQFGPNKAGRQALPASEETNLQRLDQTGYTVIPPSGTFRDLMAELDFIIGTLGCRLLMLLPIHPTPTTYGRMGRFGSPYAALSFTAVDPALAVFDPHATPLEQFLNLVDGVHQRNARIIIDIAINHTGWAASLHETHPDWLVRDADGRIEVPGAWGVRWEDLTKLDYRRRDLWQFMADVFLKWCRRGVDGFRCDAGYMIPQSAWRYIVARVRDQYPDTLFILEGLGGKIAVTRELLNVANLNWAYSELFQNYDRHQIEHYLPEAIDISASDGITIHFAETHDNQRLAAQSPVYARMRTALCALASHQGAFGFANGVEWLATEKIDVHDASSLNWGAEPNLVAHIRRLTRLLRTHPAFFDRCEVRLIQEGEGNHLVILRRHVPSDKRLLVLVNLDVNKPAVACWHRAAAGIEDVAFTDLLSSEAVTASQDGDRRRLALGPGQVMCLSKDPGDLSALETFPPDPFRPPERVLHQRRRAKVLDLLQHHRGPHDLAETDLDGLADKLLADPLGLCAQLNPRGDGARVTTWRWPKDLKREVMVPPGHFLMVQVDRPFRARIVNRNRTDRADESLPCADGSHIALLAPLPPRPGLRPHRLKLTVFREEGCRHDEAPLLYLPRPFDAGSRGVFRRPELIGRQLLFLAANSRAAALRAPVSWGTLNSRYDALLAANLNPEHPQDRWVMLTRCRAWLVYQGYSQQLNLDCLQAFTKDEDGKGYWRYHVPCGQGQHVVVTIGLELLPAANAVRLICHRHRAGVEGASLPDRHPVQLIVRPDIESRNFHHTTKAYAGPEQRFPEAVTATPRGFVFEPEPGHRLEMQLSDGNYTVEPEWHYMVRREADARRGLDPDSDLFSPGYFKTGIGGGGTATLTAWVGGDPAGAAAAEESTDSPPATMESLASPGASPLKILTRALDDYVVARGRLNSVIAGFPWFLDWGRDALIFTRGLIAAGKYETARSILLQFGKFEENGTLPNMIAGGRAANRDTSDAPLWLFTACCELAAAVGGEGFWESDCGGRPIRAVLVSIGAAIMAGTPNGVRMDPESALVFSPAHFTWMDTDHPAGTPRQGFPVEIQALWIAALKLLARIDERPARPDWRALQQRAQTSLRKRFWLEEDGYLSDCLHAANYMPADAAVPDDALRPNQLLAITLDAVPDKALSRRILDACEELLVPGAIRSLADRPVRHPLPIVRNGEVINDPHRPYQGTYAGNEDTQRKPAYHNGTAWTWLFPLYCEAWAKAYGPDGRDTALAWLSSSIRLLDDGCVGHLPEIVDGDSPHASRGCDAQAWGASEWVRVWTLLDGRQEGD